MTSRPTRREKLESEGWEFLDWGEGESTEYSITTSRVDILICRDKEGYDSIFIKFSNGDGLQIRDFSQMGEIIYRMNSKEGD